MLHSIPGVHVQPGLLTALGGLATAPWKGDAGSMVTSIPACKDNWAVREPVHGQRDGAICPA